MLWLKADMRAPVTDPDDSESTTTALREAAFRDRLEALRKARINPATDNVVELLDAAAFWWNPEVIEYLLDFNPDVNAPNEGWGDGYVLLLPQPALGFGADVHAE
jgi:hypothetical protein